MGRTSQPCEQARIDGESRQHAEAEQEIENVRHRVSPEGFGAKLRRAASNLDCGEPVRRSGKDKDRRGLRPRRPWRDSSVASGYSDNALSTAGFRMRTVRRLTSLITPSARSFEISRDTVSMVRPR